MVHGSTSMLYQSLEKLCKKENNNTLTLYVQHRKSQLCLLPSPTSGHLGGHQDDILKLTVRSGSISTTHAHFVIMIMLANNKTI